MGLDVVELVMEVEDEFGIRISDADFEHVVTVADLERLVLLRVPSQQQTEVLQSSQPGCRSLRVFLGLRATLRDVVPSVPQRIRPSDSLEELLPALNRQHYWKAWSRKTRVPLPSLRVPPVEDAILEFASKFFGLWAVAAFIVMTMLLTKLQGEAILAAGGAFVVLLILAMFMAHLRNVWLPRLMPDGVATMGDLVRQLQPHMMPDDQESFRGATVLERLRQIIHEQLSIPLDQIHPHSRFVDDLGC